MFFLVFFEDSYLDDIGYLFLLYFSMGRTIAVAGCFTLRGETNEISILYIGIWDVC